MRHCKTGFQVLCPHEIVAFDEDDNDDKHNHNEVDV